MSEKPTRTSRALVRGPGGGHMTPEVAKVLEGLSVQHAIPQELMPAIAEMLGYVFQMDEVAEKRKTPRR